MDKVLKAAQKAILARTKEAAPKEYAEAKKDMGAVAARIRKGFRWMWRRVNRWRSPMRSVVALTSNPKGPREADAGVASGGDGG